MRPRPWMRGSTIFAAALLAASVLYTIGAFQLALEASRGRIGPGLVPRIVGVAFVVATVVLLVRIVREERAESQSEPQVEPQSEPAEGRRAPAAALGLASIALVPLYEVLGAVVSGALFLGICLTYLNPGRHRVNAAIAILMPVAAYVLMSALDAPIPAGILPKL